VVHDPGASDGCRDSLGVSQTAFDNVDVILVRGEVGPQPGAEVVEHPNPTPIANEMVRKMRADEPRTASDQT
jgi:hypothetical protein